MSLVELPRLRAAACPPIGRRVSFTCPGLLLRWATIFLCAAVAAHVLTR